MSYTAPSLVFRFVFGEANFDDWEQVAGLFARPAGDLTDDEVERLLVLRRMVATRAKTLDHTLHLVQSALERLLAFVAELSNATSDPRDGDPTQSIRRLLSGKMQSSVDISSAEMGVLFGLHRAVAHPQSVDEDADDEDGEDVPSINVKPAVNATVPTTPVGEADKLYPSEEPTTMESSDAEEELLYPQDMEGDAEQVEAPSLVNQILRPSQEGQPADEPPDTASEPVDDAAKKDSVATPVAQAARGAVFGDYAELSDVAVWQAISSGAARTPRDLQGLGKQKEEPETSDGSKARK
ncbi:MAG TPA: hypothetical protein VI789_02725 [Dehalococcoidia bacterium]|nr:hypothetical protein [Dehalococcoidia bacterium]